MAFSGSVRATVMPLRPRRVTSEIPSLGSRPEGGAVALPPVPTYPSAASRSAVSASTACAAVGVVVGHRPLQLAPHALDARGLPCREVARLDRVAREVVELDARGLDQLVLRGAPGVERGPAVLQLRVERLRVGRLVGQRLPGGRPPQRAPLHALRGEARVVEEGRGHVDPARDGPRHARPRARPGRPGGRAPGGSSRRRRCRGCPRRARRGSRRGRPSRGRASARPSSPRRGGAGARAGRPRTRSRRRRATRRPPSPPPAPRRGRAGRSSAPRGRRACAGSRPARRPRASAARRRSSGRRSSRRRPCAARPSRAAAGRRRRRSPGRSRSGA